MGMSKQRQTGEGQGDMSGERGVGDRERERETCTWARINKERGVSKTLEILEPTPPPHPHIPLQQKQYFAAQLGLYLTKGHHTIDH